jgi:hypothetical protein
MKRTRAPKRPKRAHWRSQAFLATTYARDGGRTLAVFVDPDSLVVMALEAPSTGASVDAFFADHAHKVVNDGRELADLAAAIRLAEAYGEAWQRDTQPAADPCGCGEIGAPSS